MCAWLNLQFLVKQDAQSICLRPCGYDILELQFSFAAVCVDHHRLSYEFSENTFDSLESFHVRPLLHT